MRPTTSVLLVILLATVSPAASQPLPPYGGDAPPDPGGGDEGDNGRAVVILANSMDHPLALDLFQYLEDMGIGIIHTSPGNFSAYQDREFIAILGGPDAYEGIGEVVQGILTEEEQEAVREPGGRRMYVKTNVWVEGQVVFVIAGSDRFETQRAHMENKATLASSISF